MAQRILFKRSSTGKERAGEADGGGSATPDPQPRAAERRGAGGGGDTQRRRRPESERRASRRSGRRNRRGSRGLRRAGRTAREEEERRRRRREVEKKGVGVEGGRGDALLWMLDFGFLDSLADSPSTSSLWTGLAARGPRRRGGGGGSHWGCSRGRPQLPGLNRPPGLRRLGQARAARPWRGAKAGGKCWWRREGAVAAAARSQHDQVSPPS